MAARNSRQSGLLVPLHRTPDHPPYAEMIREAVVALDEEGGSSKEAISTYIESSNFDLPQGHRGLLAHHLDKLVTLGEFVKTQENKYILPSLQLNDPLPRSVQLQLESESIEVGESVENQANTCTSPNLLPTSPQPRTRGRPNKRRVRFESEPATPLPLNPGPPRRSPRLQTQAPPQEKVIPMTSQHQPKPSPSPRPRPKMSGIPSLTVGNPEPLADNYPDIPRRGSPPKLNPRPEKSETMGLLTSSESSELRESAREDGMQGSRVDGMKVRLSKVDGKWVVNRF